MIQLTKDITLTAEEHCYMVGQARTRAGGKIVIDNPRYYSTINQAVVAALDTSMRMSVADGSITTLKQFIEKQEQLHAELQQMVDPLSSGRTRTEPVDARLRRSECNYIPQPQKDEEEA